MMFWTFGKLTYDILIPPLGKSIYQLSEQEAADYFAWYHTEPPRTRICFVFTRSGQRKCPDIELKTALLANLTNRAAFIHARIQTLLRGHKYRFFYLL